MKINTADLLTIGTGILCTPVERLYELYNFLTRDNLFTHQLPRAYKVCKPHLESRFPMLKEITVKGVNKDTYKSWLRGCIEIYGDEWELNPLPDGVWEQQNPLIELVGMIEKQ